MKINKILAAGVAATLAVTSLSAVASAEVKTREFDMSQSAGRWGSIKGTYTSVYGTQTAGDRSYATATNRAVIRFSVGGYAQLYKNKSGDFMLQIGNEQYYTQKKGLKAADNANTKPDTWQDGANNTELVWQFDVADAWWSGAQVTANGYKYNEDGSKTKVSQTAKAESKWTTDQSIGSNTFELVVLPDTVLTYKEGTAIAPAYFDEIESVGVSLTFNNKPIGWYKDDTDSTDNDYDGLSAYTTSEENFKYMDMLLKKIVIPVSDAVVTYTVPATNNVDPTADEDAADKKGDGKETYTSNEAHNRAIVEAQKARVSVKPAKDAEYAINTAVTMLKDSNGTARYFDPAAAAINKTAAAEVAITMYDNYTDAKAATASAVVTHYIPSADGKFINFGLTGVSKDSTDASVVFKVPVASATLTSTYLGSDEKDHKDVTKASAKQVADGIFKGAKDVAGTAIAADDLVAIVSPAEPEQAVGGNTAAAVIAYCIAHGGYDPAIDLAYKRGFVGEPSTDNGTRYAYLERTTDETTIKRYDVALLSYAAAYNAGNGGDLGGYDSNQSYKEDIYNKGDNPNQFGGLASQCADFFNKQNNGTITFHFVSPTAANSTWVTGGVPSTEVGLKNSLAGAGFGLFVNYAQSTGSLQTTGVVDADAATVTFDISGILNDMGGYVKGNISDLYYGLNKGLRYADYSEEDGYDVGYLVDKVTLSYDDAPAVVDANTDDDAADDDAAVVVADDDDDDDDVVADDDDDIAEDDDIIEDDDDDDDDAGEIIEDDDDDDDDVNNDVDYVDADDDANPGTGVGLAVIPAIVAGAALVVSKKRK